MPHASTTGSLSEPPALRGRLAVSLLAGLSALLLAASLVTVALRLDLPAAADTALLGIVGWALLVAAVPRHGVYALFFLLPLFGNHPGGTLMELLDLLLAATTLGFALRAWRRPPPRGPLWSVALLVLLSAGLALVRTLPTAAVRAAEIDWGPSLIAQTLTAAETVPLYPVRSVVDLGMAMAWAYALCWAGLDLAFARNALRYLALGLFAIMAVGILGFHGWIDIGRDVLSRIDPNGAFMEGFQAVFWNPGWFAWYFTMAFGLVLGLLWLERGTLRLGLTAGLVVSYVYFLANRQRGGFLALHAVLVTAIAAGLGRRWSRRTALLGAAGTVALVLVAWLGLYQGAPFFLSLQRLTGAGADVNRQTLWAVALEMWRSSPLFGIGEGAFGLLYRDFLPEGSARDIGVWGDAHNTWLHLLATRGIPGLAAFVVLLVVLARKALAMARSSGPERGVGLGLTLGLIAFTVYANVQWMFYLQSVQVLFWAIVAMAASLAPGPAYAPTTWRRLGVGAGALIVALALQGIASRPLYERAASDIERLPRGFYGPSQWARRDELMRWSSRRGTLWLYPTGPVMTLQVLTTDPGTVTRPVTVTLRVGPRLLDRFDLGRGSVRRSLFLPESYRFRPPPAPPVFGERLPGRPALPLTVEVSRVWTPYLSGSLDGRFLGVAVFSPSFRDPAADDELGLVPSPGGSEAGSRWTGARYSVAIDRAEHPKGLTVPVRPAVWDGTPVTVEAFWDDRLVRSVVLGEDGWFRLPVHAAGSGRLGIVTLQASRVWRPASDSFVRDRRYVGLRIGEPDDGPGDPPADAEPRH